MKDITSILISNFVTLSLIFGLGIMTLTNRNLDRRTNVFFIVFVALVLVLDLADMADFYVSGLAYTPAFRYVTSAVGYTVRPAALVVILSILLRRKKGSIAVWIPVMLIGIIAGTSCFTHWMFWFGEHNEFHRGALGFASHIVSGIYMAALIVMTVRMYRMISLGEALTIVYISLICVAATVTESVLGVKFLLPGAMMSSCLLYYVFLYIQTNRRDILTGLLNRRSFYVDAEKFANQSMMIVSMDMNGLKAINDKSGHQAGDRALQEFADAAGESAGKRFRVYRTGGDEFMAIGVNATGQETQTYIEDTRKGLEKAGITASFGSAAYYKHDSFDDVCNQADSKMYKDKSDFKHRATAREA